jgi:protein-disulfide isomerase/uncharacterized membrane protein
LGTTTAPRLGIVLLLVLIGAGMSGLLLLQHHGEASAVSAVNQVCGDGTTSGCETVARSAWSSVRGVPLAAVGLAFYLSLAAGLVLALASPVAVRQPIAGAILVLLAAALAVDLFLLGVQVVAIKAYCGLCLATYVLNAAGIALLLPARGAVAQLSGAATGGEGRLACWSWMLTALGLAGAVVAAEGALRARAELRAATILGSPLPLARPPATPPVPEPSASAPAPTVLPPSAKAVAGGAAEGDAAHWRAEALRLQGILDDPQKLDAYFTEKAAQEYAHAKVESLSLEEVPSKGPAGAPVQVVEFSDFLCPYCRSLAGALQGFLPQSGNRLQLYYKNYPLDQSCNPHLKASAHPGACNLALGGICASEQGKFWAYHDKVFGAQLQEPQAADAARLAGEAGLDSGAVQACMASPGTRGRLAAQIEEAHRTGVQATPTLFINGKKLPRINDFVQMVDKEARAKGFPPLDLRGGSH